MIQFNPKLLGAHITELRRNRVHVPRKRFINTSEKNDVTQSQKEIFILKEWQVTYPTHSELTFKEVSELASRSRDIGNWYSKVSDEYQRFCEAPQWFLDSDRDPVEWSDEVQQQFLWIKALSREHSSELTRISKESRIKMDNLEKAHRDHLVSLIKQTPEVGIKLMTTAILPIEVHFKVFTFNSKEEAKEFLQTSLLSYQQRIYQKYLTGEFTVDDLINLLFEK